MAARAPHARRAGVVAVLTALAGLPLSGCGLDSDDGSTSRTTTRVEVVRGLAEGDGFDPRTIYEQEAPGVVTVVSVFGEDGVLSETSGEGVGTGFVVDGTGEIATNAHVIAQGEGAQLRRASEVYVEFVDGNQVEAEIVGEDPYADIALLRVDPAGLRLRPLPLGSSRDVEVGQPVAAIGSPFSEPQSLSIGVVSAVDRSIRSLTDFDIPGAIQTDAAINPGNSGGPLVDEDGRVIGVNQQIKSRSGGGEGVGFAVPIDTVKRSLDQLREDGRVAYAYLGVSSVAVYPQLVDRFDLPVGRGAWLQEVQPDGPAARAGLVGGDDESRFQARAFREGGDVVTRVEGVPVREADDLSQAIEARRPGEEVVVEAWRDGERREVRVTLGDRPLASGSE